MINLFNYAVLSELIDNFTTEYSEVIYFFSPVTVAARSKA
jgi:hypothetical protein